MPFRFTSFRFTTFRFTTAFGCQSFTFTLFRGCYSLTFTLFRGQPLPFCFLPFAFGRFPLFHFLVWLTERGIQESESYGSQYRCCQ